MFARDDRHAASVRLRTTASIAALAFPVLVVVIGGVLSALPCTPGPDCDDAQARARAVLAVAAPTLPLAARALGRTGVATIVVGVASSAPLWGFAGRRIAALVVADRSRPVRWRGFWARYVAGCAAWTTLAGVVIVAT